MYVYARADDTERRQLNTRCKNCRKATLLTGRASHSPGPEVKVHGDEEGHTPAAAECDAQTQGLTASRICVPNESVPHIGPPEEWSPLSCIHLNVERGPAAAAAGRRHPNSYNERPQSDSRLPQASPCRGTGLQR